MLRALLLVALVALVALAAAGESEDSKLLAAARAADLEYQRGFQLQLNALTSPDETVRLVALRALGFRQDPAAIAFLMPFLDPGKGSVEEVKATILSLADLGAQAAVPALQKLLGHREETLRTTATNGLNRLNAVGPGDYTRGAKDTVDALRLHGDTGLSILAKSDAAPILVNGLQHDSRPVIRRACAIALGNLGEVAHGPVLCDSLTDPDAGVRRFAAEALVRLRYAPAVMHLLMAMEANVAGAHLNRSLMLLTKQDFGFNTHGNLLDRQQAIERGYTWWAANSKTFTP